MEEIKSIKYSDSIRRFIFEHAPVRGEIVHLEESWRNVIERHEYPEVLRNAMGELTAAAVLLAATLKFQGALILQIMGKGPVKLLVVECNSDMKLRATAKWSGELTQKNFADLIGEGQFSITLDPKDGGQSYQGIVDIVGSSVAEIMQNYMSTSEQLDTRLWLSADENRAGGLLMQKLPDGHDDDIDENADTWGRAIMLAETIKPEELLELPANTLVHRLFNEDDIRLFDPQAVSFSCNCSRENVASMLKMLGKAEVDSILAERETIEVHCEFCNQRYQFDKVDAEVLFVETHVLSSSESRH